MANWLAKQKKVDLNDLAAQAGFTGASGYKKDDLIPALDKHIQSNSSKLASNSAFEEYFVESDVKPKSRIRRVTKAAAELLAPTESSPHRETTASSTALSTRTPRVQRTAAHVPLPPSPSTVTDLVERQTTRLSNNITTYWHNLGVTEYAESARETLSTVHTIQLLLLAFEAYGLQRAVLPMRYAFTIPGLNITNPLAVSLPDLFVLLTSDFWGPSSLWFTTSIAIPATVAWFFNLTSHSNKRAARYTADPFVFSIVKAVTSWLVYGPPGFSPYGLVNARNALRVNVAVPGGWFGVLVGSLVGMLASLYEVVLRK